MKEKPPPLISEFIAQPFSALVTPPDRGLIDTQRLAMSERFWLMNHAKGALVFMEYRRPLGA